MAAIGGSLRVIPSVLPSLAFYPNQFCEAGIVIRRFEHCEAVDHSAKEIGTDGYVELTHTLGKGL